ncbi:uncharacterized protein KGF55_002616 [Candida pseudojiufengensis]|uniref:uncharacterized protein n=1 Tax=Candida pseudojiufengensis TaxID=497109 RepID=UPI0022242EBF|nr:uncharacterized protein KGF55_002616 [Candida pseudojiufengensis]KAI5963736.1 hypothetical protein KGF55_002616 [Candida pseudojiufengensis]
MQNTTDENIRSYANAMIHWLSEFSDSPIQADAEIDVFTNPEILYYLIKSLLKKEDFLDYDDIFSTNLVVEKNETTISVNRNIEYQINQLDVILNLHFKRFPYLSQIPKLNLYKLVLFDDINELASMCQILYIIGTYTSHLASRGQSFIEFLSEEDQVVMKAFNLLSGDISDKKVSSSTITSNGVEKYGVSLDEYNAIKWESNLFEKVIQAIAIEKNKTEA